jgi:adenylate cyclase
VVSIVGEVGSGKSRLADEALRALPASALLLREACQSYEQSEPFAVVARLLALLLGLGQASGRAAQADLLHARVRALVPGHARFAPLLGALLDLPLPESELSLALDPARRQERLRETVVQLCLAAAAERPLVVLIDDLQWADPSSLALLGQLAEALAGRPLLLLLLYRSNSGLAEPWRELPHHTAIALGNLGPEESAALLAALLHDAPPPQLHTLIEQAHGLPLFLEELVRYLCEAGQLRRQGDAWHYHPPDDGAVPSQIEQIIVSRLDRLPPDTRGLLQVAAVLGQRFSRQLFAAVAENAGAQLDALLEAAILVRDEGHEGGYRFRHTLVREVVYANTLFARRRALHAQIAAAIERMFAARIDRYRVVLSQHYRGAGKLDRAYEQLALAANAAAARYANHEALALYEQARALAPWRKRAPLTAEQAPAADLLERMGDVCARLSDNAGARTHYEALLALLAPLEGTHWALRRAAALRKIGGSHEQQGALDNALLWYARALDALDALDPDAVGLERARLLSDMGWLFFRRNELEPARRELLAGLKLAAGLEAHELAAQIQNRLGGIAWAQGDLRTAKHYVEQRLHSTRQAGDLAGQASAYNNLGIIAETQGRQDDALAYSQQALALSEQIGSMRETAIAANTSGMALYNAGKPEQARYWFGQAYERASAMRDSYLAMFALLNLSRAQASLRRWDEAERSARQSQFIAAQMNLPTVQLAGQMVLAEAALDKGDLAAAAREYAVQPPQADESEEYGRFLRTGARIAHAQGHLERCERLLTEAALIFERLQNVPEIERTRALHESLVGTPEHVAQRGG